MLNGDLEVKGELIRTAPAWRRPLIRSLAWTSSCANPVRSGLLQSSSCTARITSGWFWEGVVERMPQYRCLVPDLPHYGKSFEQGPFEMGRAATAVAELIRSRTDTGQAHLVGWSLGAQVGVQLLATEPKLVDRAVLCGVAINTVPFVQVTRRLLALPARNSMYRWMVRRYRNAWQAKVPSGPYR